MVDRIPTHAGRVKLTPVAGTTDKFDMEMADEPTVEGTPLNKRNLLQDSTAVLLGLPNTAVPDDAFAVLALQGRAAVRVTITVDGSPAIAGIAITGLTSRSGETTLYTDANGEVSGFTDTTTTTITTRDYIDLPSASVTLSTPLGEIYDTAIALTSAVSTEKEYSSSSTFYFSPYVEDFDVCAVGGGGSGGSGGKTNRGGGGAGGGYVDNELNITAVPNEQYTVTVGAGGVGVSGGSSNGSDGRDGGTSSVSVGGTTVATAVGGSKGTGGKDTAGQGGEGNGNGGNQATAGSAGTVRKFGELDGELFGGGGAGGGYGNGTSAAYKSGGAPYGGRGGGNTTSDTDINGAAGSGIGGGSGGGYGYTSSASASKGGASRNGYRGGVFFRWRYAA